MPTPPAVSTTWSLDSGSETTIMPIAGSPSGPAPREIRIPAPSGTSGESRRDARAAFAAGVIVSIFGGYPLRCRCETRDVREVRAEKYLRAHVPAPGDG